MLQKSCGSAVQPWSRALAAWSRQRPSHAAAWSAQPPGGGGVEPDVAPAEREVWWASGVDAVVALPAVAAGVPVAAVVVGVVISVVVVVVVAVAVMVVVLCRHM